MQPRALRKSFLHGLWAGLKVVWPVLSVLLGVIVALGVTVGTLEGWSLGASIYFAFITGLTVGYGDLAPSGLLTRSLAIAIGGCGMLCTAIVAAVAVKALTQAQHDQG